MTPSNSALAYVQRHMKAFHNPPSVHDLERIAALAFDAGIEVGDQRLYDEGYRDGVRGSQIENGRCKVENPLWGLVERGADSIRSDPRDCISDNGK